MCLNLSLRIWGHHGSFPHGEFGLGHEHLRLHDLLKPASSHNRARHAEMVPPPKFAKNMTCVIRRSKTNNQKILKTTCGPSPFRGELWLGRRCSHQVLPGNALKIKRCIQPDTKTWRLTTSWLALLAWQKALPNFARNLVDVAATHHGDCGEQRPQPLKHSTISWPRRYKTNRAFSLNRKTLIQLSLWDL